MHLERELLGEGEWDREGSTVSQTPFYGAPRPMQRVRRRRAGPLSRRSAEKESRGFPGGSGKNPPAKARRHGFNPWSRKIPRAAEQLSLCATAVDTVL